MDDYESLSHTTWTCKYHVMFIPKCRRKALYQELRRYLGEVFRKPRRLCRGILTVFLRNRQIDSAPTARPVSGLICPAGERRDRRRRPRNCRAQIHGGE
jgi:hypothetical protein